MNTTFKLILIDFQMPCHSLNRSSHAKNVGKGIPQYNLLTSINLFMSPQYPCIQCDKHFFIKWNLKRHIFKHTGDSNRIYDVCALDLHVLITSSAKQKLFIWRRKTTNVTYVMNTSGDRSTLMHMP